jgi:hypothetical protein
MSPLDARSDAGAARLQAGPDGSLIEFDPTRSALLLLGGDKAGNWERWHRDNIPLAEQLYRDYTGDRPLTST